LGEKLRFDAQFSNGQSALDFVVKMPICFKSRWFSSWGICFNFWSHWSISKSTDPDLNFDLIAIHSIGGILLNICILGPNEPQSPSRNRGKVANYILLSD